MADTKITALTALTAADPANDVLPIVDVSDTTMAASGTTKKISVNNILGASGTATLASATITGDLTVATSSLKVTGGKVGILTATPGDVLEVVGSGGAGIRVSRSGVATQYTTLSAGATGPSLDASSAIGALTFGVAGSIKMTVDSSGNVGVGGSPSQKLHLYSNTTPAAIRLQSASPYAYPGDFTVGAGGFGTPSFYIYDNTNSAFRFVLDTSGNVGIGVTPSAWSAGKAVELAFKGNSLWSYSQDNNYLSSNAYFNGGWKYGGTGKATLYSQYQGTHIWSVAGSGTAGNAITLTDAMTLDASGNLLVGTTSGLYRGQFVVTSGADRNIFAAQVTGASNGLQVQWDHATTTIRVILANIPTSSAGLASGTLWNDAGTIKIV